MRIGEIRGLCEEDIIWDESIIKIERQVARIYGYNIPTEDKQILSKRECIKLPKNNSCRNLQLHPIIFQEIKKIKEIAPKTPNAVREIPIPDILLEELLLAKKRYDIKKSTIKDFHDYGYVWCRDDGTPYNRRSYEPEYTLLRKELHLEDWVWHSFRHFYGSLLANNNVSLKAISQTMGHATANFTNNVYIDKKMLIVPKVETFDCAEPLKKYANILEDIDNAKMETITAHVVNK